MMNSCCAVNFDPITVLLVTTEKLKASLKFYVQTSGALSFSVLQVSFRSYIPTIWRLIQLTVAC